MFKGRLSPEQGARIVQVLDAAVVAIREEQRNTAEDVSAETPIAAHRADALERVADNYLANDQAAVNGGDRCTVHIHTDMKTLRADGGEPVFSTPKGDMIPPGPETRFSGNVFALTTANRRQQLDIGPRTLVPRWYGEEMDDAMAIDGLLRRE